MANSDKNQKIKDEMKEEFEEWKTRQEHVVEKVKETLDEIKKTETKKDVLIGGAIVVSVLVVSAILKNPQYLVALSVTGALGFLLYKNLMKN